MAILVMDRSMPYPSVVADLESLAVRSTGDLKVSFGRSVWQPYGGRARETQSLHKFKSSDE